MMKLRLLGPGYYLDGPGVYFRVRPDQQSALLLNERIAEKSRIIERAFAHVKPELRYLEWSARVFAARHAAGLCRKREKHLQAFIWKWKSRMLRWQARWLHISVHDL